ncbi:FtsX-like permease family protein [Streptomyces sp. NPDC059524]|uniref:FtsX-like permease family protein n=1 Tax=Streptomyces sp. NPDC059524 TaxID=3346856 RepID=UPI0036CD1B30
MRKEAERDIALFVPFLAAFGTLGLVMEVLIVGHVVSTAVASGHRRIGMLEAIGFTPGQVVRAYVGQALIPASVGIAGGVLAGHLPALPVLSEAADAYGATPSGVAPWVDVAVIAGTVTTVATTAWASAWRAGRLRTVDALALGRGPSRRAAAMVTAVVFCTAAVTFTVGLGFTSYSIALRPGTEPLPAISTRSTPT